MCFDLQGLVHLGKGTLTLGPYHCDRSLMMPVAVGGLLSVLVSFLDVKNGMLLCGLLWGILGFRSEIRYEKSYIKFRSEVALERFLFSSTC